MNHKPLPLRLRAWWRIIRRISRRNYPRAMQLAGEWGKRLAEWEAGQ